MVRSALAMKKRAMANRIRPLFDGWGCAQLDGFGVLCHTSPPMNSLSMRYSWVALLTAAVAFSGPCFAEDAKADGVPAPESAQPAFAPAQVYGAMGYAMAMQLRLNAGFSDEELASVFQGMRDAAAGKPAPHVS